MPVELSDIVREYGQEIEEYGEMVTADSENDGGDMVIEDSENGGGDIGRLNGQGAEMGSRNPRPSTLESKHFERLIQRDGFGEVRWEEWEEWGHAFVTIHVIDQGLIKDFEDCMSE